MSIQSYINYIGADGNLYSIKGYAELLVNKDGFPIGYENLLFPDVELVVRGSSYEELCNHPLHKAREQFNINKIEARAAAEKFFREEGFYKNAVEQFLKQYWS